MSIKLKNDFTVDLATAHSRLSKKWRNRHWQWSELLERCSQTKYTGETAAEYARLSRDHSSILHLLRKYDDDFKYNPQFRDMATRVNNILNKTNETA